MIPRPRICTKVHCAVIIHIVVERVWETVSLTGFINDFLLIDLHATSPAVQKPSDPLNVVVFTNSISGWAASTVQKLAEPWTEHPCSAPQPAEHVPHSWVSPAHYHRTVWHILPASNTWVLTTKDHGMEDQLFAQKSRKLGHRPVAKDTGYSVYKQTLSKHRSFYWFITIEWIDIIIIAFCSFTSPLETERTICFLKSAPYRCMTNTKQHCYCCESRRGTYDLVSPGHRQAACLMCVFYLYSLCLQLIPP